MNFDKLDEKGAAPTLVVFLLFVLISTSLVINHLRTTEQSAVSSIQMANASDTTRATLNSINSELEEALRKSATAAMYDVGMGGGTIGEVEEKTKEYMNNRIEKGWDYSNLDTNIPQIGNGGNSSIKFIEKPDGSLLIRLRLEDSEIKHILGPTAYGTYIQVDLFPRFRRIESIAKQIDDDLEDTENLEKLEKSYNENYKYEGIKVEIEPDNLIVRDMYAGRRVIV